MNKNDLISIAELKKSVGLEEGTLVNGRLRAAGIESIKVPGKKGLWIRKEDVARAAEVVRPRQEISAEASEELTKVRRIPFADAVEIEAPGSHPELAVNIDGTLGNPFHVTEEEKKLLNRVASSAPAVDYDALKDQGILIHRGNCDGPCGYLESDEALHYYREEDLVKELRRRGWEVSCTKSI